MFYSAPQGNPYSWCTGIGVEIDRASPARFVWGCSTANKKNVWDMGGKEMRGRWMAIYVCISRPLFINSPEHSGIEWEWFLFHFSAFLWGYSELINEAGQLPGINKRDLVLDYRFSLSMTTILIAYLPSWIQKQQQSLVWGWTGWNSTSCGTSLGLGCGSGSRHTPRHEWKCFSWIHHLH